MPPCDTGDGAGSAPPVDDTAATVATIRSPATTTRVPRRPTTWPICAPPRSTERPSWPLPESASTGAGRRLVPVDARRVGGDDRWGPITREVVPSPRPHRGGPLAEAA